MSTQEQSKIQFEDLVTTTDIAEGLGMSRQRAAIVVSEADFPPALGRLGRSLVWRWSDVTAWLEHERHASRPELRADLERRLRGLERIGIRVEVDRVNSLVGSRAETEAGRPELRRRIRQLEQRGYEVEVRIDDSASGPRATPSMDAYAVITLKGWGWVASEPGATTYDEAVESALENFDRKKGRELAGRELRARIWELQRLGFRFQEGGRADTEGSWTTCRCDGPEGFSVEKKGLSPREATAAAVDEAESWWARGVAK